MSYKLSDDPDMNHHDRTQVVTLAGRRQKHAERTMNQEATDDEVRDGDEFAPFYASGLITQVLGALKSGKEATIHVCRADPVKAGAPLVAAKVYKPREGRAFRNASTYGDGLEYLAERERRAINTKTGFGRTMEHGVWVQREYARLRQLHEAGVAVPRPIAQEGRVIVMEFVGDEDGPAAQLKDVRLDVEAARRALRWLLYDVELMLGANVVHADLSPYNVLWWKDRSFVIDFPQAVDPRKNKAARVLLERDVRNVCRYFARIDVEAAQRPEPIAADLWRRYMRAEL